VAYGRELEVARAAQTGTSFSGDAEADALLRSDPNAFLIGILFTQGIPAERAWSAPLRLKQRLGTLDPAYLVAHPAEVRKAVQAPPMLHRFKETLPEWIVSAAELLLAEYGGDASRIWPPSSSVTQVTERLMRFRGIGRKKAVMAAQLLVRHFGARLTGREAGQVAYDVHVRRVFLRSGLAEKDSVEAIEAAAARACPASPGTLDLAAWLVGRETCRPTDPDCEACRLAAVCERKVWLNPVGVGHERARKSR
jgi:uncharacterized HhH-GPD family protein